MPHVRIVETGDELAACLEIRREVFIEEQGVSEEDELDDRDLECVHFLALPVPQSPLSEALGTARLLESDDGCAKAQRVAVLRRARGQNVGHALMSALEAEARRRGFAEVGLAAQLSAIPFYQRLGYEPYGDVFDDAGIPHRSMKKRLEGAPPKTPL